MSLPTPFPLAWPDGWPRTPTDLRRRPLFDEQHSKAVKSLARELRLLGAIDHVITSDLPTKRDGTPYASRLVDDSGAAVYWRQPDSLGNMVTRVMACDRWHTPAANIRAIALSVEALRGIDRWGSSTIVDRAFAGFAALPPAPTDWRSMLGNPRDLDTARATYRRLALAAHPDHGGNGADMARLNEAWDAAQRELGP